ncbi:Uncharacterised protein [Vibrio cholerae]|nr:Uncharacterised protein [Vibrio cholerae]CSD66532.1 Uncharacterised protein [Vibrio cholerae]
MSRTMTSVNVGIKWYFSKIGKKRSGISYNPLPITRLAKASNATTPPESMCF